MNLVYTMAGKYSRFQLFGARVPKYLLPLGDKTILSKIIEEMFKSNTNAKLFFIANRNDQLFYPVLKSIMNKYSIPTDNLIYTDDSSSQLETATLASEIIPQTDWDLPVSFMNIDTVIINRSLYFYTLKKCTPDSGLLDTFNGKSPKYSFVRSNKTGEVIELVDYKVISEFACSGLYGFGSYSNMKKIAAEVLNEKSGSSFTDLYNSLLKKKLNVQKIHFDNLNETIVLGTPEEYITNIHRFD